MILVHNIIAHRQIGEALYLLALISSVALLFLLLTPEDIRLRDDCKLQDRIFVAPMHFPVAYHHLPRQQLMVVILRVKTV